MAAFFVAFQFFPGRWCEPVPVRLMSGVFVAIAGAFYLHLVDDKRHPRVGTLHRMGVGGSVGLVVAAIAGGSAELYGALAILGVVLGHIGFRWLNRLPF